MALSAIGGGVGAGVGASFTSGLLSNSIVQAVASSAITQGIGVATGLQDKFSWAGVAAAGVGALAAAQIGGGDSFRFARSGARAIANAATRSLIEGSDFGDNLIAALPDVIGQTIGEAIAGRMSYGSAADSNAGTGLDRTGQDASLPASTPELDALAAQSDALAASADALLNGTDYGWGAHTIASGDSYAKLSAADFAGLEGADLTYRAMQYMEVNPGVDPRTLQIGQEIVVPGYNVEVSEATARAYALSDAEYRDFVAQRAAEQAEIAFWAEVSDTWQTPVGPMTEPQAVSAMLALNRLGRAADQAAAQERALVARLRRVDPDGLQAPMLSLESAILTVAAGGWAFQGGKAALRWALFNPVAAAEVGAAGAAAFGDPGHNPIASGLSVIDDLRAIGYVDQTSQYFVMTADDFADVPYFTRLQGSQSFDTFDEFKGVFGRAGDGADWHHIVEQYPALVERFGARLIHNTDNIVQIDRSVHGEIGAFYSAKQPFTGNADLPRLALPSTYRSA